MHLFWRVLLGHVVAIADWLLLGLIRVNPRVKIWHVGDIWVRIVVRRVRKIWLNILNIMHDHLVWLVIHHVFQLILILLSLLVVIRIGTRVHILPLLVQIGQLLLQLLVVLARSLVVLTLRLVHLIGSLGLGARGHIPIFYVFLGNYVVREHLRLRRVPVLLRVLLGNVSWLWGVLLILGLQNIHYVDVIRLALSLLGGGGLLRSRLSCVAYHLALPKLVFTRGHYLFGVFVGIIEILTGLFLVHQRSDLLLGALEELVDLTLPLVLNGVIPPLNTWWVHRVVCSSALSALSAPSYLNSGLRSRGAWRWGPHFSGVAFLCELHILALDILRRVVIAIIDNDSELVKLIEAIIWVLIALPLLIITLGPLFVMIFVDQLILHIWVHTGVVVVA